MSINRKRKASTKPKLITTIEMEVGISKYFGVRQNIIVPNISWGFMNHEADMFVVKKSGYASEIEIKRTKADLIADFKKPHRHIDSLNRIQELYYAFPESIYNTCKDIIPDGAGILTCDKWYNDMSRIKKWVVTVRTKRKPTKNKSARKLTDKERLKIAHLGTMRIWSLKEKIIKSQNDDAKI